MHSHELAAIYMDSTPDGNCMVMTVEIRFHLSFLSDLINTILVYNPAHPWCVSHAHCNMIRRVSFIPDKTIEPS